MLRIFTTRWWHYPQTWYWVPHEGLPREIIQWTCEKVTGHVISDTEWGYGGGPYGDVWCRWCNKLGKLPIADMQKRFEDARSVIWRFTACDIAQGEWQPVGKDGGR